MQCWRRRSKSRSSWRDHFLPLEVANFFTFPSRRRRRYLGTKDILFAFCLEQGACCNKTRPLPRRARYLRGLYQESVQQGNPLLPAPPTYVTFARCTSDKEFTTRVRWLRVVSHARCPDCAYFKWKLCGFLTFEDRLEIEREYMQHLRLSMAQKRVYYGLRALCVLACTLPELFLVGDGPAPLGFAIFLG